MVRVSQGLVIPCFNEAQRLPFEQVKLLLSANSKLDLLFVDDGSTDATFQLLSNFAAQFSDRVAVLRLDKNGGKAEAVRLGLLQLLKTNYNCIGYADADFATPASELVRLLQVWETRQPKVLLASRVRLLGSHIERLPIRHFLGRIFATFSSMALRMPVYDTQCGAKIFSKTAQLEARLQKTFVSRWVFDVELIGRLRTGEGSYSIEDFIEVPLQTWIDVRGSKLKLTDMLRAALDLGRIALDLRRNPVR